MTSRNGVYEASPVKRYRRTNAELADLDDAIVRAVEEDKPVSLRGVYYRVVSAGAVPKTDDGYDAVGRRLLKLRDSGRVSYWDIRDGTRWTIRPKTYDSAADAIRRTRAAYRQQLWADQPSAVHIYSEKDAITGVVEPVTAEWDIPLGIARGFSSATFAFQVAYAITAELQAGKLVYIYQLGDHDPAGISAWEAFERKVRGFIEEPGARFLVEFQRIAVTPEQIEELSLPTRPTKTKGPGVSRFTGESVEVDAIPAPTLRQIVEDSITQHIDWNAWRVAQVAEQSEKTLLDDWLTGLAS